MFDRRCVRMWDVFVCVYTYFYLCVYAWLVCVHVYGCVCVCVYKGGVFVCV